MSSTRGGHYAIRTQLGKVIRADFYDNAEPDPYHHALIYGSYWTIWISANSSFTAGTYYRLYADGKFEHWHLYEDGTEMRLDA